MATCTYNPSYKHIPKNELKVGMTVVCGDETYYPSGCWAKLKNGKLEIAPLKILKIDGGIIYNEKTFCHCFDIDHLYLVPEKENQTKENQTNLITNIKNNMPNLMEKVKSLYISEPNKSLQKFGFTTQSNELTSEGREVFINWLFEKNKKDFCDDVLEKLKVQENSENK